MPAQAPAKPGQQKGQAAPVVRRQPFPVGVLKVENPDYDQSLTQTTGTQQFPNHSFEPTGWLRGLWYQFDMTVTGQATNSVSYSGDNPFSVINKFTLKDVGNREVFGPMGGYDWMTVNKFGGYHEVGDPRADLAFSTTVGTGSTAGTFTFMLYVPLELVARDALGAVENKSSSSAWKAELFMDSQANTYNQVPSVQGSLRVRVTEDAYTEPAQADEHGRPLSQTPPAVGTLQYWVTENSGGIGGASGTLNYNLDNGIGYSIRNILYKLTRSGTSRANGDADWPDPVTLTYGKVQLFQRYKTTWISKMGRAYGFSVINGTVASGALGGTADTALQRENGVFPVWFTDDFGTSVGAELRNGYLNTKTGTVLKWKGTLGGSASADQLNALINYVIPPGNDPGRLRAR
ncbi:MAG TPA: hypothetical protein VKU39_11280 [Streptosporangiaceae bacterium]|nr:hypothetical protein [Streptosporangiaceae bacterium]